MARDIGTGTVNLRRDSNRGPRTRLGGVLATILVVSAIAPARSQILAAPSGQASTFAVGQSGSAPEEVAAARHLLARATYGVRDSDLDRVLAIGRDAWIEEQLFPAQVADHELERRLRAFPAAEMSQYALYKRYPPPQIERPETPEQDVQPPRRILFDLVNAKLQRAVYSNRQLEAVMTDFWFNHFNVFFAKGADRWLVGEYEREAIRPHVFGRFEDLLLATARHPAMLFYLDNWQNVAPDSLRPEDGPGARLRRLDPSMRRRVLERRGLDEDQVGRLERALTRAADRGINENYARELLELHTLGVEGGYAQEDVIEVARAFTGWSIAREGASGPRPMLRGSQGETSPIEFRFRPELHDRGRKTILGQSVDGQSGANAFLEGEEVLRLLARHPSTARHVATKLATAFAADRPPEALVSELERVFLATGGDLREVTQALFNSHSFYSEALHESKIKSPFELVASALRVTEAEVGPSRALVEGLQEMGQLPYMSPEPTGYAAQGEEWMSSGSLLQRFNFALALADDQIRGVRMPRSKRVPSADVEAQIALVLSAVLPGAEHPALASTLASEVSGDSGDALRQALGLALASPEFQRR